METKEDYRFQTQKVSESSMDVSSLNNLIVSGRPLFKKVKVQVIEGLTRQMKKYAKRKRGEKQVSVYQKKVQTALEEISAIKSLNPDYAVKFAFANELPFEKIAAQGDVQKRALGRIATHPVMQQKVEKWRNCHDDWKSLAAFMLSKNTGRRFKKKSTQKGDSMAGKIAKKKLPKPIPVQEIQIKCQKTSKQYLGISAITSNDGAKFRKETVNSVSEQFMGHTDEKMELADFSGSENESVDSSVKKPVEKSSLNRVIHENSSEIKEKAMNNNTESNRNMNKEMVVKKICLDDLTGDGDLLISGNPIEKTISFLFESDLPRKKIKKDNFFMDSGSEVDSASDDNEDGHSVLDVRNQEENSSSSDNEGSLSKNPRKVIKSTFLETLSSRENKRKSNPCEGKQRKQNDRRCREPRESDGSFQRSGQKEKQKDFNRKQEESNKEGIPRFSRSTGHKGVEKEECAEKLHPSWEASRKRKKQMSTLVEFKGKKIKFNDD